VAVGPACCFESLSTNGGARYVNKAARKPETAWRKHVEPQRHKDTKVQKNEKWEIGKSEADWD